MHPVPVVAIVVGLLLAGCATPGQPPSPSPELPAPTVGDDPPVLDSEALIGELQRYAGLHPDEFGGLFMHPPGSGSFVVLFTDRLDEHGAALAAISPRVSVRQVQYTEAELMELMESLDLAGFAADGVEPLSAGLDTINNRVTLDLKANDPTLELRLELEYGGRVEVTVHPLPGAWSNVAEGNGWRLLAAGEAGPDEAYTVRAATDEAAWDDLWSALRLDGPRPEVELADEVVVSFAHGIGSGCRELRLDGIELGDGVVFSRTNDPLAPRNCTSDLVGAVAFVVAVDRDALPADGFVLQLAADTGMCEDCGFTNWIEVPLP